ncbi:MAG: tetratricopeptide repeat protein [Candidatus Cloacimonas sp.]
MKKWMLIALIAVFLLVGCTVNRSVPQTEETKPYTGVVTKVAILPLKTMDSSSRYIQKILTVRDLAYVFAKYPQFSLLDMDQVAQQFKLSGYQDVEDLEIEEMKEIAEMTACDILAMGSITSVSNDQYALSMRFFSVKTDELTQLDFSVPKQREKRWDILEKSFITKLEDVVSNEVNKIYNIALNYYSNGNYPEAEKNLKTALGLNPELKDAYYYLGSIYYKEGKNDLAIQNLELNLVKNPQHILTLTTLIDIYEKTNQPNNRLATMEKLALITENEEMWLTIGNLYAEKNDLLKAENALKKAIELKPDFTEAKTRLALLLYDNNRYEEAIPYLEILFEQFPENDLIASRLATAYQKAKRLDDAIAKYEVLIKNNPKNALAYLSVVNLYRLKASETTDPAIIASINKKSIDTLNALITNQPSNALAYMNMAAIYLGQNKFQEAETYALQTIQRDPTLYLPYVYLATVYQNKGTVDYNRFIDLEKQAAQAVGTKAKTLKTQRDNAKTSAAANFKKSLDYLNNAKVRATSQEAVSDINSRIARVNQLINQVSSTY